MSFQLKFITTGYIDQAKPVLSITPVNMINRKYNWSRLNCPSVQILTRLHITELPKSDFNIDSDSEIHSRPVQSVYDQTSLNQQNLVDHSPKNGHRSIWKCLRQQEKNKAAYKLHSKMQEKN